MRYYWTNQKLIGSDLIRWGTESDCSHFAAEFGQGDYAIVVESSLMYGFTPTWRKMFLKKHTLVHCLEMQMDSQKELDLYYRTVDSMGGKRYDWKAVAYWSGLIIAEKLGLIRDAESKVNKWADRNSAYCTEVLAAHTDFLHRELNIVLPGLDRQMLSPHAAFEVLSASNRFKRII